MSITLIVVVLVLQLALLALGAVLLVRSGRNGAGELDALIKTQGEALSQIVREQQAVGRRLSDGLDKLEARLERESVAGRQEAADNAGRLREEVTKRMGEATGAQREQLGDFSTQLDRFKQANEATLKGFNDSVLKQMSEIAGLQKGQLDGVSKQFDALTQSNEKKLDQLRGTVEAQLTYLQEDNAKKLELMRQTVDEKLAGTLEKRLGESFRQVSERLEQVHAGLGEMRNLANGVGDLKRVLTNVKTRGTWGEIQLGQLLEQILTPEQYATNQITRKGGSEPVEYAIRLPGRDDDAVVWLPIDSKFPTADYERLLEAVEHADGPAIDAAGKAIEAAIKKSAKDIREKYVAPPDTTDFAILFVPVEGLYAEILRRPGLVESLQREQRIVIAGPTTLAALLNSLQMGFKTLAIEKRSSEVWQTLAAVKTEFGKFGGVLDRLKKQLVTATKTIDAMHTRKRAMLRELKSVQELPSNATIKLLGENLPDEDDEEDEETEGEGGEE